MKRLYKMIFLFLQIFSLGLYYAYQSINKSLSQEDSIETVEVESEVLKLTLNSN